MDRQVDICANVDVETGIRIGTDTDEHLDSIDSGTAAGTDTNIYVSRYIIYLPTYLTNLSIHQSIYLTYVPVHMTIHTSVYIYIYISICVSMYLSIRICLCLSQRSSCGISSSHLSTQHGEQLYLHSCRQFAKIRGPII